MNESIEKILGIHITDADLARPVVSGDSSHPLYGVKGWLFFGVVMNMYIGPVLFVLMQIFMWGGISMAVVRYPGLVFVGLFNLLAGGFLIIRAVLVARDIRDLRPRSVQAAKSLLWLRVILVLVGIPISFASGLPPQALIPGIAKSLLLTAIGVGVVYSYLKFSRRVAVTFPDSKDD